MFSLSFLCSRMLYTLEADMQRTDQPAFRHIESEVELTSSDVQAEKIVDKVAQRSDITLEFREPSYRSVLMLS